MRHTNSIDILLLMYAGIFGQHTKARMDNPRGLFFGFKYGHYLDT